MKVGIVGTGPWGKTLAEAFRKQGCEIVAHSHAGAHQVEGLGHRMPWPNMIGASGIDAIIAASTPEVTLKVASKCIAMKVPVLATKPLLLHEPLRLFSPFYVDHVHLWSPVYRALKDEVEEIKAQGVRISSIRAEFSGMGPVRPFPSLNDYGPHALSLLFDLIGTSSEFTCHYHGKIEEEDRISHLANGMIAGVPYALNVGNNSPEPKRCLRVVLENDTVLTYEELNRKALFRSSIVQVSATKKSEKEHDPLAVMISQFKSDIVSGTRPDRLPHYYDSMDMAVAVTKALATIASK